MGSRRTLVLIAAILIGAVGAYVTYSVINSAEERAYDGANLVQVYKVAQPIPKGTPGNVALAEDLITVDEIPQEYYPPTAVTDAALISEKVALTDLAPNQVLVEGLFVDQSTALVTMAERLNQRETAITVSLDDVRGVGGNLVPGDRVNLIVLTSSFVEDDDSRTSTAGDADSAPVTGEATLEGARHLYQAVEILAIDKTLAAEPGAESSTPIGNAGLITFRVPPEAAQRIAIAASKGAIYATLVPPNYAPSDVPPVDETTIFDGVDLTPYPQGA